MTANLEERFVSALVYLLTVGSVIMIAINLLVLPLFTVSFLWALAPAAALLLIYWSRSRFVRSHLIQALLANVFALMMPLVPWVLRMMVSAGLLSERWHYTGFGGYGTTPVWIMMTLILFFWAIFIFTASIEGMVASFTGKPFYYPLGGYKLARLTGEE